jgi:protein-tyrosine phosphatase/membrane-associated phospholipid phosphatase
MKGRAAWTSAGLSVLFLVVYSGTNWLTSLRTDVGTWYFAWERHIPFVPLLILPYFSIDAFFVAAPFLARDRAELSMFARRITLAMVAGSLCFLALPLRFAFERPAASGLVGVLFDAFRSLDRPFNLFPSLHITLLIVLADLYLRRVRGWSRGALGIVFLLIATSTVLTYQHHVIDVAGGIVLGILCCYVIAPPAARVAANGRTALIARYAAGGTAAVALSVLTWPWGALLLSPATALFIVAAAYAGAGPAVFRKTGGRLDWSARVVLAPYLLGQHLSLWYYSRQCAPWNPVAAGVLIGRRLTSREAAAAVRAGVTAIVDLTAEFSESEPFRRLAYLNVPVLDLTAPTQAQLADIVAFIDAHARRGMVYVHCKAGYSRSAAAVGAYLMATRPALSPGAVGAILRAARPSIVVRPEIALALQRFAKAAS